MTRNQTPAACPMGQNVQGKRGRERPREGEEWRETTTSHGAMMAEQIHLLLITLTAVLSHQVNWNHFTVTQ